MSNSFHIAVELARERERELHRAAEAARAARGRLAEERTIPARRRLLVRVSGRTQRALAASVRRGATNRGSRPL